MDNEFGYDNQIHDTAEADVTPDVEPVTGPTQGNEPTPEPTVDSTQESTSEPTPESSYAQGAGPATDGSYAYRYDRGYSYNYQYNTPHTEPPQQPKKEKKTSANMPKWVLCICLAIVFGIVASVVSNISNRIIDGIWGEEASASSGKEVGTTNVTPNKGSTVESGVADVAKNVMPSVVSITNLSVQEVQYYFFGGTTTQEQTSSGSGIIIGQNDAELLIVTNNHVIEGSTELTVTFADDTSLKAHVKGTDADIDIAVIAVPTSEIKDSTMDAIKIATLGDSDALSVGEPAIAIGNALGYGQSVTYGIISALERQIDDFDSKLIQTDAAINPGNSGGALLNANGEVIGINTVKVSADAVEGMGYAIPISDVNDIINELMNRETREKVDEAKRGTLGIQGITVDERSSEYYGIPQGVQISELLKGGAAEKAKLPRRGVITKFDGTRIRSMEDLTGQLEYYAAGETVDIVVATMDKDGEYVEKTYSITLSGQSVLKDQ